MNRTGLTWDNLSSHRNKLDNAGTIAVEKTYLGKRMHIIRSLSDSGCTAFDAYRYQMQTMLANTQPPISPRYQPLSIRP